MRKALRKQREESEQAQLERALGAQARLVQESVQALSDVMRALYRLRENVKRAEAGAEKEYAAARERLLEGDERSTRICLLSRQRELDAGVYYAQQLAEMEVQEESLKLALQAARERTNTLRGQLTELRAAELNLARAEARVSLQSAIR